MAARSIEELERKLREFADERDWEQFHSPKNLAMALCVEVAEILEHLQWLTEEQSRSLSARTRAAIEEEVGDVMIYIIRLADKLGIDPLRAAFAKLKVNGRKYPIKKAKGNCRKYTEL